MQRAARWDQVSRAKLILLDSMSMPMLTVIPPWVKDFLSITSTTMFIDSTLHLSTAAVEVPTKARVSRCADLSLEQRQAKKRTSSFWSPTYCPSCPQRQCRKWLSLLRPILEHLNDHSLSLKLLVIIKLKCYKGLSNNARFLLLSAK